MSMSQPSKLEKEKQRLMQEKCQTLLNEMLRDDDNKYCVDCDAKGPRWASWNLGIFLCIRCAGIHRNLGVHISRVKSVNLDTWKPEQVVTMQQMGNSRARAVYEASLPDNHRRPQTDVALENFIRAKYEHKKYIAQEWVQPRTPVVNWDSEIEESLKKKKEVTKRPGPGFGPLPTSVPIPKPKTTSVSSQVANKPVVLENHVGSSLVDIMSEAPAPTQQTQSQAATPTAPKQQQNSSDDLFGLNMSGLDLSSSNGVGHDVMSSGSNDMSQISNLQDLSILNPNSNSNQKMTKESIMSLYGSGTTAQAPPPQQILHQNPFATPMYGQQQQQQQQQNMWNPNPYAQQQQQHQQQPQQQLFGGLVQQTQPQFYANQNQPQMMAPPAVNLLHGIQADISPRPEFNWTNTTNLSRN